MNYDFSKQAGKDACEGSRETCKGPCLAPSVQHMGPGEWKGEDESSCGHRELARGSVSGLGRLAEPAPAVPCDAELAFQSASEALAPHPGSQRLASEPAMPAQPKPSHLSGAWFPTGPLLSGPRASMQPLRTL